MSNHCDSPPPPPITSPSKKRLVADPEPSHCPSENETPNDEPYKDKITRELPNLSECHGCGHRIDYSNPKARLQPLDSFWRVVLLCKRCIKQVNSCQACVYCFKNTVSSVSDCFTCPDCEHLVHKDCVVKFGNSPPWSYACQNVGLGFSVCVDCWVPDLLKRSVKGCRKHKNENGVGGKADSDEKSVEEMVKEANYAVKSKVAVAAMAKEKALRKVVAARNARELASNALHLAAKKDVNGDTSEVLVRNSKDEGNTAGHVTKVVDDSAFAFRLHRAMNSSPRITKNICSMNMSCSDLYKKGSNISGKQMDFASCEDGMVAVGGNSKLSGDNDGRISAASTKLGNKESGSLKTYKRHNLERKGYSVNAKASNLVSCSITDHSRVVSEKHSPQNVDNAELLMKNAQAFGQKPEQSIAEVKEEGCGNATSDRYFLKYTKKKSGSKSDRYFLKYRKKTTCSRFAVPKEAASGSVSSEKENKHFILGRQPYSSNEGSGSSDASLRSCVVNQL